MLEVLYNDKHNTLSLVHSPSNDVVYIVDDTLHIYKAICYSHYDATDRELCKAWEDAVREYYAVYNEDVKDWKEARTRQSVNAFWGYLKEDSDVDIEYPYQN